MKMTIIEGVRIKKCNWMVDDRGQLTELLRADDEMFQGFGQSYITTCDISTYKPIIKAWHCHERQYDNFTVIRGKLKLVLYDDREGSSTKNDFQEVILDAYQPQVVQIPPLVWHGFMALGDEPAWVLNIPSQPYNSKNPDEIRRSLYELEYDWDVESR
jgi:dTDP-4-dehydrorhamnose 3,5-epimerase